MSSQVNIDWRAIRPLNGSRQEAFEELVSQIAYAERPVGAEFTRKGKPDAGVECFAVCDDGSEWAWQAKYFDVLGYSQWSQLDESVKTALEKHPKLSRYFVCVPMDRADARLEKRKSALQKWEARVKKWSEWANDRGMKVEFVWWGSTELLEVLHKPAHAGRVRFWFDKASFDAEWFEKRLDEAIAAAGARYTPELHVDLPIGRSFQAFLREPAFFDAIRTHMISVRKEWRGLRHEWRPKKGDEEDSNASRPAPEAVVAGRQSLDQAVGRVLASLGALVPCPFGPLTLRDLVFQLSEASEAGWQLANEVTAWERDAGEPDRYGRTSQVNERLYARRLAHVLREARRDVEGGLQLAEARHLVVTGPAGSGKTHLVCDVVKRRVREGAPALAVLGNQLLSKDEPWRQVLSRLDLADLSATEFIGALEAAAQSRGTRALLVVDALNEGAGRTIWPDHIASFLERTSESEWVSVVLTVRSSYEKPILGDSLPNNAAKIEHEGFADRGYEAMKTFFGHFGIELPSTPLLAPEFTNPLFLKVLCRGLSDSGQTRLPRGFHGISATFDQYLSALNERLAGRLGYNPKRNLVSGALHALVARLVEVDEDWLDNLEAEEIVNGLLTHRRYEDSLFRALLSEGVLLEEHVRTGDEHCDVVQIGYERLFDHLAVSMRLDAIDDLETAFEEGGPLHFVNGHDEYLRAGQLEALCVQVPERVGKELATLAPGARNRWEFGQAFTESLAWRKPEALGKDGIDQVETVLAKAEGLEALLELLLTVGTLPGHPLNAEFLDTFLAAKSMADRDATWSIALHRGWKNGQALHRLIDWAWSIGREMELEDESLLLAGVVLAWTLSCPNRFLRDRATKAMVALYAGRAGNLELLLRRFAEVDDFYVRERLMAVAYGVSLGMHNDGDAITSLAQYVYDSVFADQPPPHILLRDYARGVVERAVALGASVEGDLARIRPPYTSDWPHIPTEEGIAHLKPNWETGGELEWSRNRIGSSIFNDDFAYYVIGTNHGTSHWLNIPLSGSPWRSLEERKKAFVDRLDETGAKDLWSALEKSQTKLTKAFHDCFDKWLEGEPDQDKALAQSREAILREVRKLMEDDKTLNAAEAEVEKAVASLREALSPESQAELDSLFEDATEERPPFFPLDRIQRYVLWRVFDLGWTIERFGHFDRHEVDEQMRAAAKPERFGKKYQWLAFHEISALVADHYQYREPYSSSPETSFDGPWQTSHRDIDPSCLVKDAKGGAGWDGHQPSWWASATFDNWDPTIDASEWAIRSEDLPAVPDLVAVRAPNGSRWLNLDAYFDWQSPVPSGLEKSDTTHRGVWYLVHAYLVRGSGTEFLEWADSVTFTGRWMPDPPTLHAMFLGEHAWSPAARYFEGPEYASPEWSSPGAGCPLEIASPSLHYLHETGNFDCSTDAGYTLRLPSATLVRGMKLSWAGKAADFVGKDGGLRAFDPSVRDVGPAGLLVRADTLQQFLSENDLSLCWCVIGERRELSGGFGSSNYTIVHLWGGYELDGDNVLGFLKASTELVRDKTKPPKSIYDLRTPPSD